MSVPAALPGAEPEDVERCECEQFLSAREAALEGGERCEHAPRKRGSLFRQRVAVGTALSLVGLLGLLGFSALAGHGAGGAARRPPERAVGLSEAKIRSRLATTGQEAEFLGQKASEALGALAAYYRSTENIHQLFRLLVTHENSSEWARGVMGKIRRGNSSEWASGILNKMKGMVSPGGPNTTSFSREDIVRLMNLSHRAEDRRDGNVCAADEELFHKLCYKRCSSFDGGKYPFRTTPFSCCKTQPCGFLDHKLDMKICSGYNVAGDSYRGACPHTPGACLDNEELYLGRCYKRCSLLTNFTFPFRLAPATCCKLPSKYACMNPALSNVSLDFGVGGGKYYGDPTSPSQPHLPIPALTEVQAEE